MPPQFEALRRWAPLAFGALGVALLSLLILLGFASRMDWIGTKTTIQTNGFALEHVGFDYAMTVPTLLPDHAGYGHRFVDFSGDRYLPTGSQGVVVRKGSADSKHRYVVREELFRKGANGGTGATRLTVSDTATGKVLAVDTISAWRTDKDPSPLSVLWSTLAKQQQQNLPVRLPWPPSKDFERELPDALSSLTGPGSGEGCTSLTKHVSQFRVGRVDFGEWQYIPPNRLVSDFACTRSHVAIFGKSFANLQVSVLTVQGDPLFTFDLGTSLNWATQPVHAIRAGQLRVTDDEISFQLQEWRADWKDGVQMTLAGRRLEFRVPLAVLLQK